MHANGPVNLITDAEVINYPPLAVQDRFSSNSEVDPEFQTFYYKKIG